MKNEWIPTKDAAKFLNTSGQTLVSAKYSNVFTQKNIGTRLSPKLRYKKSELLKYQIGKIEEFLSGCGLASLEDAKRCLNKMEQEAI